jgi:hypothetical protein
MCRHSVVLDKAHGNSCRFIPFHSLFSLLSHSFFFTFFFFYITFLIYAFYVSFLPFCVSFSSFSCFPFSITFFVASYLHSSAFFTPFPCYFLLIYIVITFSFSLRGRGGGPSLLGTLATYWPIAPAPDDGWDDCGQSV